MLPGNQDHRHAQFVRLLDDLSEELKAAGQPGTREAIAIKLRISKAYLSRLENRHQPLSPALMEKLSHRLQFDEAYFDDSTGRRFREFAKGSQAVPSREAASGTLGAAIGMAKEILAAGSAWTVIDALVEPLSREVLSLQPVVMAERALGETDQREKRMLGWGLATAVLEMLDRDPVVIDHLFKDDEEK